jgi:DNA-binding XRE family transcriptional regulator
MTDFRVRGHAVRQAYALLGLSRTEFAEKAGLSPKTLTNITNTTGQPAPCSLANAAKIAAALGWDVDDVIDKELAA